MASRKILMYSFKGGAGRTVTTANVAHILARELNRRVLCIDLDIESAGSSVLFDVQDRVRDGQLWAVQDVLRGYIERPGAEDGEVVRESIALNRADFEKSLWPKLHTRIYDTPAGYLHFVPGRTVLRSATEQKAGSPDGQAQLERLLQKVDGLNNPPEIVLYDSASGQQDIAMIGLTNCHVLVIFVRWTRQFIYGTVHFLHDYICSRKFCSRITNILVVPTAVPLTPPQGSMAERLEERRRWLADTIADVNHRAISEFDAPKSWVKLLDPIYECAALKWDDRVFLTDPGSADDPEIARVLLNYRVLAAALASPRS